MKLKIVGKPVALCSIDMKKFKVDYKKKLDLKNSIKNNFKVLDKGKFDEETLFKSIHLRMDWGKILDLINDIDKDKMEIRFFKCEFKDKVELTPDLVSKDGRLFVFKQEVKEGVDVIMINSFLNGHDYNIKSYLDSTTFNYGKIKWQRLVEYGGGKD